DRQKLCLSIPAQLELHFALLDGAFADGQPSRDADQVRIAEFLSRAREAVVEQHFEAGLLELLANLFRPGAHGWVFQIQADQVRVKGSNLRRPDDAVIVVVLLDPGCGNSRDSDTVA